MKKWMAFCLVLCLSLTLISCGEEKAEPATEPVSQSTPLLYKVTDADGDAVWLFGSIHMGKESFYPLPNYVLAAYDSADSIGFEFDMIAFQSDMQQQMELLQGLMYTDGTTIKDHIPAQLYEDAVVAMKQCGIYMSMMDYYYPVVWYSMIESAYMENAGGDSSLGVDMYLLNKAYEDEKPVEELESASYQMEVLGGLSEDLQVYLLEESIGLMENEQMGKLAFNAMMDAWALGDAELLAAAVAEEEVDVEGEAAALYAEFSQQLIVERNRNMTDYAVAALAQGREVFICVGAAHIVGEGAMADLLAQEGYTVEVITE